MKILRISTDKYSMKLNVFMLSLKLFVSELVSNTLHIAFLFLRFTYLYILNSESQREGEVWKGREIFHSLIHPPDGWHSQGSWSQEGFLRFPVGMSPNASAMFCCFFQGIVIELDWKFMGLKLVPMWNTSVADKNFAHYATMLTPLYFALNPCNGLDFVIYRNNMKIAIEYIE